MQSEKGSKPSIYAGLPHARLPFFCGSKYCPVCVREQRESLGFATFTIQHQVWGVESCYKHRCKLVGMAGGNYGYADQLLLPSIRSVAFAACELQDRFAQFTFDVLEMTKSITVQTDFNALYYAELDSCGYITKSGRVRLKQVLESIDSYYGEVLFNSELGLPKECRGFYFIETLLHNHSNSPCHPAKHLIFSFWLFNGDSHKYQTKPVIKASPAIDKKGVSHSVDAGVLLLLKKGYSFAHIRKVTGKSSCYIRRISELNALYHSTTSQSFSLRVHHAVIIQAQLGRHRNIIASNLSVSVGYVEQTISNSSGLVAWRKKLKLKRKEVESALIISKALLKHPEWLRKHIRTYCSQEYFCLYHHNKELLESVLPPRCDRKYYQVHWEEMDDELYKRLSVLEGAEHMAVNKIDYVLKARGRIIKHVEKLPRVKTALIKLGKLK